MRWNAGRWALPAGVLVVEYLLLSFLVDFTVDGPALSVVNALRLAIPVTIGAAAAGWMLARRAAVAAEVPPLPRNRVLASGLHLGAFAVTLWLALRMMGEGAPPLSPGGALLFVASAVATVLLAIATAVPIPWLARATYARWRLPLLAFAVGLLVWRGASYVEGMWSILSNGTLHAAAALLQLSSRQVVVDTNQDLLGVSGFEVIVAPVCSGVDGIGLVVTFLAVWIALARDRLRFPRVLVLLPIGAAAAWSANAVRIAALVLVGASGHEDFALGGLHSKLGWILFTALALLGVAIAEHVPWFGSTVTPSSTEVSGFPEEAAPYLAPLLAALATALVTSTWSSGPLDAWYGARPLAALAVLLLVRRSLPAPSLSMACLPVLIGLAIGVAWVGVAAWNTPTPSSLGSALAALPPAQRAAWIAIRVACAVLVIPLIEELAFRGFLLPWLVSPDFVKVPPRTWTWPAVLLSSAAFGAIHEHWLLGTAAGAAFAAARLRRGRLSDAVLAHAVANAVVAAAALSGRWELWG